MTSRTFAPKGFSGNTIKTVRISDFLWFTINCIWLICINSRRWPSFQNPFTCAKNWLDSKMGNNYMIFKSLQFELIYIWLYYIILYILIMIIEKYERNCIRHTCTCINHASMSCFYVKLSQQILLILATRQTK